jgi:mutator protein MutT
MNEIPVMAAVIRREGRLLLGRRPDHKRHGGLWEFPGGKVESGESDQQAVERELSEELGLSTTSVGRVLFESQDPDSTFLIRFVAVEVAGDPRALEHSEIGWFDLEALRNLRLAPSDSRFVFEHVLMENP